MTVSLWIRETVGGKRTYRKPNKKKLYPNDTVFCLRFSINGKRRWETTYWLLGVPIHLEFSVAGPCCVAIRVGAVDLVVGLGLRMKQAAFHVDAEF